MLILRQMRTLGLVCAVACLSATTVAFGNTIAHWAFEDDTGANPITATDGIAGLTGTAYNNTGRITLVPGPDGSAIRFENVGLSDAQGATLRVPDNTVLTGHTGGGTGFDSITIEVDIRIGNLFGQAQIVRKVDTATGLGYEIFLKDTGHVGFRVQGQEGELFIQSKNILQSDGAWHHIQGTIVSDRSIYNAQVVVDGVVTRRSQQAGNLTNTSSPLTLGGFVRNSGTIGQRFDGWIDNVVISTGRGDLLDTSGEIDPTPAWDSSDHLMGQAGFMGSGFIADPMPTPEIHAASITQRANGNMVAVWFGGTAEGHPDVGVWQSDYVGNTWTAPHEIAPSIYESGVDGSIFNPVIYQVPDSNSMLLFYLSGTLGNADTVKRISNDGGVTWSTPQTLPVGVRGSDRNQPLLLDSGILITPNTDGGLSFDRTPDFGETWLSGSTAPDPQGYGGIQPALLTHSGGRLQVLGRSQSGSIVTSWSDDDGQSWSALEQSSLPSNNSAIGATTLADGRHLLVYNHSETPDGSWGGPRTPLVVSVSDDGVDWELALVLEDESGEFSYPSVFQSDDGLVHVVYTWNRLRVKHAILDPSEFKPRSLDHGIMPVYAGDLNYDGFVGIEDLNIVLGNWNTGTPPTTGTPSIPEPATLGLMAIGAMAFMRRRYTF